MGKGICEAQPLLFHKGGCESFFAGETEEYLQLVVSVGRGPLTSHSFKLARDIYPTGGRANSIS